jgi:DNA primase
MHSPSRGLLRMTTPQSATASSLPSIPRPRPAAVPVESLVEVIAARLGLKRRGQRFVGQCPDCGGSNTTDKFNIRLDGGYKCYGCDTKGDIITWLRHRDGLTCPDAHDTAGRPCRLSSSCAVRATCRLGDGGGVALRPQRQRTSVAPRPAASAPQLATAAERTPTAAWQAWAEDLVHRAAGRLASHSKALEYLASRGIPFTAAAAAGLGWRDHDQQIDRADFGATGLDPDTGKSTLWVPGGIVIPVRGEDGRISRLLVRRTSAARALFLPHLKYWFCKSGVDCPTVIVPPVPPRGAVIVEADLDAIAVAAAHPEVIVVALRSVQGGISANLRDRLAKLPAILVSLDADSTQDDGKQGAGPKAVAAWTAAFRAARFWPPPSGKDAGEYAQQGGDLRLWIEAGLPPVLSLPSSQELPLSAGRSPQGGQGVEDDYQATAPRHYLLEVEGVGTVHVTDNQELWEQLTAAGDVAFSENELSRLQAATATMTSAERQTMVRAAIIAKQTLPGAYIRAGRLVDEQVAAAPQGGE